MINNTHGWSLSIMDRQMSSIAMCGIFGNQFSLICDSNSVHIHGYVGYVGISTFANNKLLLPYMSTVGRPTSRNYIGVSKIG